MENILFSSGLKMTTFPTKLKLGSVSCYNSCLMRLCAWNFLLNHSFQVYETDFMWLLSSVHDPSKLYLKPYLIRCIFNRMCANIDKSNILLNNIVGGTVFLNISANSKIISEMNRHDIQLGMCCSKYVSSKYSTLGLLCSNRSFSGSRHVDSYHIFSIKYVTD